jgi:uncharacterized protein YggU (UPF0235/DUF167 family)
MYNSQLDRIFEKMPELDIKQLDGSVLLTVKVVPASSITRIAGMLENILKVKVAAPPEKGKANKALTGVNSGRKVII